jgi:tyrosine-protein phosphatase YwqE
VLHEKNTVKKIYKTPHKKRTKYKTPNKKLNQKIIKHKNKRK